MFRYVVAAVLICATGATAQSVSYKSNNTAAIKGDPNKIVCEREEKIGTRLGGKKVCLTVAEWNARRGADRDQMERVQAGARARCSNDNGCDPGGWLGIDSGTRMRPTTSPR